MISAAPTVLALETDSAWVVILAVSLATLLTAIILRRLLARPGGMASSAMLLVPLVLPVLAGVIYQRGILPEIAVMQPFGTALMSHSENLFHLLMVNDGNTMIPYAISGQAGPWILLIGITVVSFMLIRRAAGMMMVGRLVARCRPVEDPGMLATVGRLSREAGLAYEPQVLLLPDRISGAFAAGLRRGKILISADLIEALEPDELRAILAHEIAHLQARDVPIVFFAGMMRDVVAWNPFAHIALRKLVNDREFEADRRAAALTGDPLAVASGLLKIVETARNKRGMGQKAVLAFWKPGHSISKRITGLIAVADGRASVASANRLPFVVATLLVALTGVQVAEKVVSENPGAFAIVWGDPESAVGGEIWEVPKRIAKSTGRPARGATVSVRGKRKVDLALPVRTLLGEQIRVKATDVEAWMLAVSNRIAGISDATLRWEARQSWTAEPIFSGSVGPTFGIYRINQQI